MTPPTASPTRALAAEIDPVRFEVIRNGLLAITEEMGATLRRAAYSTNIKTRGDFSCAFFDRELRTIAQAFAQPAHLGSLAHLVPRAIRAYGPERLQPGDGILINDPYQGGVHLNDITLITPVFHEGALLGYVANIAHHVDVGGGAPGSIGVSSEIYQEGLVIPAVRFVKGGQIDPDIFAMIRANFRGTREISGDFRAQTAANRLGVQGIEALVAQHGAATLTQYLEELLRYTERRTRAAFAEFPDGTFSAEMLMDGDGVTDEPVKLAATVTIESGRLSVDLTGCDEQRKSPTNATSSQSYSGVRLRAQVPDRSRHPGQRRLLPAGRHQEPPRLRRPRPAPGRRRRRLGDRHAALRPALPRPGARAAGPRGGRHQGLRLQHRLRRREPGQRRVLHLLRDHRRRLRRDVDHRRDGRRAVALPEHGERAHRGDGDELPGAHRALRADRELRGRRPPPRRPRRAPRLSLPRPHAELLDPLRQGPLRARGGSSAARPRGRRSTS